MVAAAWAFTKLFQPATQKLYLESLAMCDHNRGDESISQGGRKEMIYGPSNSLFMTVIQVFGFFFPSLLSPFLCTTVENISAF